MKIELIDGTKFEFDVKYEDLKEINGMLVMYKDEKPTMLININQIKYIDILNNSKKVTTTA